MFAFLSSSLHVVRLPNVVRSSTSRRHLNRVFFERHELFFDATDSTTLVSELPQDDHRAVHISQVLKLQRGDKLKVGVLDVGMTDNATILRTPSASFPSIQIELCNEASLLPTVQPNVDLILALPRPQRLERILPVVACLGVHRVFLTGAAKVEKDYFGSHLLRFPNELRKLLVEGLSQSACDTHVPVVEVKPSLYKLLNHEFDNSFPVCGRSQTVFIVAHPPKVGLSLVSERLLTQLSMLDNKNVDRVVIAIGPEGGWQENEIRWFLDRSFKLIDLGERVLRTDIAVSLFEDDME
jgi:RsmE family RNA methyltransferase